jgi:dipeptidyl-peptidase-3
MILMQVMLEAGQDFLTIKECVGEDGKPDMIIAMDREKILTVGQPAIAAFLMRLQVYKATADIKAAKEMYDKYSELSEPWAGRRDIVVARKQPRMILVQANTRMVDEKLELVQYDPSPEGMVKSWADRFPDFAELDTSLAGLASRDAELWG